MKTLDKDIEIDFETPGFTEINMKELEDFLVDNFGYIPELRLYNSYLVVFDAAKSTTIYISQGGSIQTNKRSSARTLPLW